MAKVSGAACILLAAMILLLPLPWLVAAIMAAAWHELCHYCAIMLFRKEPVPFRILSFGAQIALPPMSRKKELLCTLAGPFGGLSLLLFARWLPRTAICAAFQSLYNLLPMYPLDGGRALQCVLSMLLPPPKVKTITDALEKCVSICILLLGLYGFVALKLGLMPVLVAGFLLLRVKITKMPCKPGPKGVQ